jgi:hypothetical protein
MQIRQAFPVSWTTLGHVGDDDSPRVTELVKKET